ncbi:hypothetical protein EB230_29030 [Mesorhizobium sp. NZP2234]|nr:hypothetical protein EB230_29030 [Mesorhizobium sp. NZP2234]
MLSLPDHGLIVHLKEPMDLIESRPVVLEVRSRPKRAQFRGGACVVGQETSEDGQFVRMMRFRQPRRMLTQPANQNTPNSRLGPAA